MVQSMSTLPAVPEPSQSDAGRIALEIAEIASGAPSRHILARQLAGILLRELDAGALALFWLDQNAGASSTPGERSYLRTLSALAPGDENAPPPLEDLMRAAAESAFSGPERTPPPEPESESSSGNRTLLPGRVQVLPVGTPRPWGAFCAWWPTDGSTSGPPPPGEELLRQLRHSLTLATMPTHLLDVARPVESADAEDARKAPATSSFISMISHELRTPLNSINGFLEIVLNGQVGPLNPRQEEFLGYVQTSALQLTTQIEDILLISKADSGRFALRPATVDVDLLLHQSIQSVAPAAEKAGVHIGTRVPGELLSIWGDELRLRQVITNLLHNSIKFSPPGSEITVTLSERGDFAEFAVADHGKGVALEDQDHVFERFYQSESSQHSGGYGLGLSIARLIVEQHGGRIWLSSTPGVGATFYFTLPLRLDLE